MSNGGAVFPAPGGRMLLAWPDAERGQIVIHADRPQAPGLFTRGPHAAAVAPVVAVPALLALCLVTVTWQPSVVDDPGLAAEATWRAAARSVAHAIGLTPTISAVSTARRQIQSSPARPTDRRMRAAGVSRGVSRP